MKKPHNDRRLGSGAEGSIMITLVVSIVLAGALTAALLPLFNVSMFSVITQSTGTSAEYMAVSGYRYAASEYVSQATIGEKLERLGELDGFNVSLADDKGRFSFDVDSFWFILNGNHAEGTTSLNGSIVGGLPEGYVLPSAGKLRLGVIVYDYTGASLDEAGGTVTFTVPALDKAGVDGQNIYLVFNPSGSQTLSPGASLVLPVPGGQDTEDYKKLFPERNGVLEIAGIPYTYSDRSEGGSVVNLNGLRNLQDATATSYVDSDTDVVLKKQVYLTVTGSVGQGTTGSRRTIAYNVYISDQVETGEEIEAPILFDGEDQTDMSDLDHWIVKEDDPYWKLIPDSEIRTRYYDVSGLIFSRLSVEGGYEAMLVENVPTNNNLWGIWGNAAENVYVCGDNGTILHFDGGSWSTVSTPTTNDLRAIWGTGEVPGQEKVIAVGESGAIITNEVDNNTGWQRITRDGWNNYTGRDLWGVWGVGWNQITTYGDDGSSPFKWNQSAGNWRYWDGGYGWMYVPSGVHWRPYDGYFDTRRNSRSTWENNDDGRQNLFTVGQWGNNKNRGFIYREKPNYKSYVIGNMRVGLRGIWGSGLDNIFAVGTDGTILNNDSTRNNSWSEVYSPTSRDLWGIWGSSRSRVYAVGEHGTILINEGSGWQSIDTSHLNINGVDLHDVWGSRETGIYAVGDRGHIVFLGFIDNPVKSYFLPLKKRDQIEPFWQQTGGVLTYTIQMKQAWGKNLPYGAAGVNFRWAESADNPGLYEGYGVSVMRYRPSADDVNDYIPNSMKPQYDTGSEVGNRVLLVLWKQTDFNGYERRQWLAYKDVTNDPWVVGQGGAGSDFDGEISDWLPIVVRVREQFVDYTKFNDIDIFYGDAVQRSTSADTKYDNTIRLNYPPLSATSGASSGLYWPEWDLTQWSAAVDRFTAVRNVSVGANPQLPSGGNNYWVINPVAVGVELLGDRLTIRDSSFTSPDLADGYGSQEQRPEIAVHVFGNIREYEDLYAVIGTTDFAVRMGVPSGQGDESDSAFGTL